MKKIFCDIDDFVSKILNYISTRKQNKKLKRQLIDRDKEIADLRDTVSVITLELHNQKAINTRLVKERNNLQIEVNGLKGAKK